MPHGVELPPAAGMQTGRCGGSDAAERGHLVNRGDRGIRPPCGERRLLVAGIETIKEASRTWRATRSHVKVVSAHCCS